MYKHAPMEVATTATELTELREMMLRHEMPIFQAHEDFVAEHGAERIVDETSRAINQRLKIPFVFNGIISVGNDKTNGRVISVGSHFHQKTQGVTLHREIEGEARVSGAYVGKYHQYLPDEFEDLPTGDRILPIDSLFGLIEPIYDGITVPGRITAISEYTFRKRLFRKTKRQVLMGAVHDFNRIDQADGDFVALSSFTDETFREREKDPLLLEFVRRRFLEK